MSDDAIILLVIGVPMALGLIGVWIDGCAGRGNDWPPPPPPPPPPHPRECQDS